jgi:hypothetical protein
MLAPEEGLYSVELYINYTVWEYGTIFVRICICLSDILLLLDPAEG